MISQHGEYEYNAPYCVFSISSRTSLSGGFFASLLSDSATVYDLMFNTINTRFPESR